MLGSGGRKIVKVFSFQILLHTEVTVQIATHSVTNGFRAWVKVVQSFSLLSSKIFRMSCLVTKLYAEVILS